MDRRQFLKGLSSAVVAGAAVAAGCDNPQAVKAEGYAVGPVPTDKMTYRTDAHDQKVSLLGFGMMRLPVEGGVSLRDNPDANLDQEAINQMVDYAIEHGVNRSGLSSWQIGDRYWHCPQSPSARQMARGYQDVKLQGCFL